MGSDQQRVPHHEYEFSLVTPLHRLYEQKKTHPDRDALAGDYVSRWLIFAYSGPGPKARIGRTFHGFCLPLLFTAPVLKSTVHALVALLSDELL